MFNSRHLIYCAVAVLVWCFLGNVSGGSDGKEPKELAISAEIPKDQYPLAVGRPVLVGIFLRNLTDEPLFVQDWEKSSHVISLLVNFDEYPGGPGEKFRRAGSSKVERYGLKSLPPGLTRTTQSVVPLFPGKMSIIVRFFCRISPIEDRPSGKIWQGRIYTEDVVADIPLEIPAEMKNRYEELKKRLLAPDAVQKAQLKVLSDVAAEKHYFAAHFIREACDSLPAGPLHDAAVGQLVELAKFGTAYESFEYLIGVAGDEKTPLNLRESLLAWFGEILGNHGRQWLAEQAGYKYPENLVKQARELIERLSNGRDPYLAAKAREILKTIAAKEKEDKEAKAKQAAQPAPPAAPKASPPK